MTILTEQLVERFVGAYKAAVERKPKSKDQELAAVAADTELSEDLQQILRAFRGNQEQFKQNLARLTHLQKIAIAYFDPELAKIILDDEAFEFAGDYSAIQAQLSKVTLKENKLDGGKIRADFLETLDGLKHLSSRFRDDIVLTTKILGVTQSVNVSSTDNTTAVLFDRFYIKEIEHSEGKKNEGEKKQAVQLASNNLLSLIEQRSDIASVVLVAPQSVINNIEVAVAVSPKLEAALFNRANSSIIFGEDEQTKYDAYKLITKVATTNRLSKIMNPSVGEYLGYIFWIGTHPSQLIKASDVVERIIQCRKENGEPVLNEALLRAFLENKLLFGKNYWKEADLNDWEKLFKFLVKRLNLSSTHPHLFTRAQELCQRKLGEESYELLMGRINADAPVHGTPQQLRSRRRMVSSPLPEVEPLPFKVEVAEVKAEAAEAKVGIAEVGNSFAAMSPSPDNNSRSNPSAPFSVELGSLPSPILAAEKDEADLALERAVAEIDAQQPDGVRRIGEKSFASMSTDSSGTAKDADRAFVAEQHSDGKRSFADMSGDVGRSVANMSGAIERSVADMSDDAGRSAADMSDEVGYSAAGLTSASECSAANMSSDVGRSAAEMSDSAQQSVSATQTGVNLVQQILSTGSEILPVVSINMGPSVPSSAVKPVPPPELRSRNATGQVSPKNLFSKFNREAIATENVVPNPSPIASAVRSHESSPSAIPDHSARANTSVAYMGDEDGNEDAYEVSHSSPSPR